MVGNEPSGRKGHLYVALYILEYGLWGCGADNIVYIYSGHGLVYTLSLSVMPLRRFAANGII